MESSRPRRPPAAACWASSSRLNQRASITSSPSTCTVSAIAVARNPIINPDGNGQPWEAMYVTVPTGTPVSSATSRRTASSRLSETPTKPARVEYEPAAEPLCRASRHLPRFSTSMITAGVAPIGCHGLQADAEERVDGGLDQAGAGQVTGSDAGRGLGGQQVGPVVDHGERARGVEVVAHPRAHAGQHHPGG